MTKDAQRIRAGLDEAHIELRELLNSFRAPVDQRGLVSALEKLVERFGRETGIHVLFQNECREPQLSSQRRCRCCGGPGVPGQYPQACHATRCVLLSCRSNGPYCLLIEDDGVGFEIQRQARQAGRTHRSVDHGRAGTPSGW